MYQEKFLSITSQSYYASPESKKAFSWISQLRTIEIPENSQLKTIGVAAFQDSKIKSIRIPSQVERIEEKTFCGSKLENIEFADDSKLEYIGCDSFYKSILEKIVIPSHVKQICDKAFSLCKNLKTVEFSNNSELKSIGYQVFSSSSLNSLSLPSCVENFDEEWCFETTNLNNFTIIRNKVENISNYNDTFILGKSDINKDDFDVLLFARRDVEKVTIPYFIKRIAPFSFSGCTKLMSVDVEDNSQLEIIDGWSFHDNKIQKMTLPSSIVELKENWFIRNPFLTDIKIIRCKQQNFMYYCDKFILGKTNPMKKEFDTLVLARRDLKEVIIPSYIKRIESCAFQRCGNLESFRFEDNSELQFIGKSAFCKSSIETLTIPSRVRIIEESAFFECKKLKTVYFENGSELEKISENLFYNSSIESISIPSNVRSIESCAFKECENLKNVTFAKDSKLQKICEHSFFKTSIEHISIPPSVTLIDYAFVSDKKLRTVEIPKDSKLQLIGNWSFLYSTIEKIFIPEHVIKIKRSAFENCEKLQKVEFSDKSELKKIGSNAFVNCLF